jgi:riboflavin kinase / FMN adenylyltransferase
VRVHSLLAEAFRERGCVAAVGNFDGVHLGHRELFRRAAALARVRGVAPLLLTFSDHPARRLAPHQAPPPLTTLADRLLLAEREGMEAALVLPFTSALAAEPAEAFVRRVLAGELAVRGVVVGEGWRFGRGREGDTGLLAALGEELGFDLVVVPPVCAGGAPVSSTRIREAIAAGRVDEAALLLGRPHFLRGVVEAGHGVGRKLGFPTVNLHGEALVPPPGVYAGACAPPPSEGKEGSWLAPAAIFIGRRETFGGADSPLPGAVEAHLPGIDRDLYGQELALGFLSRLRDTRAFPDPAALAAQIALDVPRAVETFAAARLASLP